LGLLIAATIRPRESAGQSTVSREYTIKAAYLYNFGRYARWPEGTFCNQRDPFVIGILGTDPFGDALPSMAAAKKVDGRTLVIRRFDSLEEYTPCHILFVTRLTDPGTQRAAVERFAGAQVLLVGEAPGFVRQGGIVEFYTRHNKIRFRIDREAARRAGLKINSKLLDLEKRWEESQEAPSP